MVVEFLHKEIYENYGYRTEDVKTALNKKTRKHRSLTHSLFQTLSLALFLLLFSKIKTEDFALCSTVLPMKSLVFLF